MKVIRRAEIVYELMVVVPKPDNVDAKNHSIDFYPLLEGHVQFGKLGVIHKNHTQEELKLINYSYELAHGIRMLAEKIKGN